MTGPWPQMAPELAPLGQLAQIQLGKMLQPAPTTELDEERPYLRAGLLTNLNSLSELPVMFASPDDGRRYAVRQGDLVVAEGGDCGQTGFVPNVPDGTIIQNSLHRVRSGPAADLRFLRYCLRAIYDSGWLEVLCNKSTFGHLTREKLASLRVPNRPLEEQRAIADYLDRETARIDALIAAKERLTDLFEQRWWAVFVNRTMRTHAPSIPLRRVLASLVDGPFGSAFSSADYVDEGAAVIRLGNIGFAEYRSGDQARIPMHLYETFRQYDVQGGDLLIAGLGDERNHAGRACVSPALGPAIVKGKCFRGRVLAERCSPDYLALLLSSELGASALTLFGRGSTRAMINLEIVKAAELPIPRRDEQDAIVRETLTVRNRMRRASAALTKQLALVREHRQALIAAAVTGHLEVRVAA